MSFLSFGPKFFLNRFLMPWVSTFGRCQIFRGLKCNGVIIQIGNMSLLLHFFLPNLHFVFSLTRILLHIFLDSNQLTILFLSYIFFYHKHPWRLLLESVKISGSIIGCILKNSHFYTFTQILELPFSEPLPEYNRKQEINMIAFDGITS